MILRFLAVYKGPDYHKLTDSIRSILEEGSYQLSRDCNRMAYPLEGNLKPGAEEIITAPVQPGTVQLTSSGKLIVLMRDAQTTGGYSRIFQLPEDSMNKLAQKTTRSLGCIQIIGLILGLFRFRDFIKFINYVLDSCLNFFCFHDLIHKIQTTLTKVP